MCVSETYSAVILIVRNRLNKEMFCVILLIGRFEVRKENNSVFV
jgi:hypothetical protein